jgi:glycosyltransferase involved in cell wall biosynthesis
MRTLARLLKTGAVDILHAHNGRTALLAAVAVRLAGRGRAVATQHFLEPAHLARRGVKALFSRAAHRWVERQMGRLIAISEAAKTAMLARGEGTEEKISVVPNGMPQPVLAQMAATETIRAELGLAPGATLIVAVARLEREKNLETLVAAMKLVAMSEPRAVCVIAGAGSQEAALISQIAIGGVGRTVQLLGFRSDTLALMRAGDLFVLPSAREPFGLVLIEAMSVGKPVIATCAGGPLEIVVPGETGLLVAPVDAHEMAGALIALVRDPDLRQRMGEAGHARFLNHFTVERMARATIEVYEKARVQ